jgi:ribonuclease HI
VDNSFGQFFSVFATGLDCVAGSRRAAVARQLATELSIRYSPMGKIHNFSYRLEFACTNNVTEFEALLLGIENAYNLGCGHLTFFGDSKLVVNLVCKIYSPSKNLMKRYTQTVWALILNLLSFISTLMT